MTPRARHRWWVLAAILAIGLVARLPGVWWGANFPFGWYGHHVDEYTHLVNAELLIAPHLEPRWPPNAYPKGLAAHVAVPFVVVRAATGRLMDELPSMSSIITAGRLVSVAYGVATIWITYLFGRRLFGNRRVAEVGALYLALGGIHVTQSHFFVADVPMLFWYLLGCYVLLIAFQEVPGQAPDDSRNLSLSAFCLGIAAGIKLNVAALPSLAILAWSKHPRVYRTFLAAVAVTAGFVLVNIDSYSLKEIVKTLQGSGSAHLKSFSRLQGALLYAVQLPALVSAPLVIAIGIGVATAARRWRSPAWALRQPGVWLAVILPMLIMAVIVVFGPNNFPRHLIPFLPFGMLAAAYGTTAIMDRLARWRLPAAAPVAAVTIYLAAFVADGEHVFIQDPRNAAASWLQSNVPAGESIWWQGHGGTGGYVPVVFPTEGRPSVLVIEMHRANAYLSGMGWRNSMPTALHDVHGVQTEADLKAFQDLFRGKSEYREVARFGEGYVMPEYRLVDRWIGNRARNYVAEIVILRKTPQ